jgi:YqjK-like protein
MSQRLTELALRKQMLTLRSEELRNRLEQHVQAIHPLANLVERVRSILFELKQHPEWSLGAAAALLILRPRFIFRWLKRGLVGWRLWRSARDLIGYAAASGSRRSR